MSQQKVQAVRLLRLVEAFEAALARETRAPDIEKKIEDAFTDAEKREILALTDSAFHTADMLEALEKSPRFIEEAVAPMVIVACDKSLNGVIRVLGEEKVAGLIDPSDKSADISGDFDRIGAKNLARLYAPKP